MKQRQLKLRWPVVPALLAVLFLGHALADLSIIMDSGEDEAEAHEYLVSGDRMRVTQGEEMDLLLLCEAGEFAWLIPEAEVYWQGTPRELIEEFDELLEALRDEDDVVSLAPLFAEDRTGNTPVRVTSQGQDEILGYAAEEYLIEYEQDGDWHTHENVWVAPELLREIEEETGGCMALLDDTLLSMVAVLIGDFLLEEDDMGWRWDVMTAPEYREVAASGFPVKNHSSEEQFGVTIEATAEVTGISTDALPEDLFRIPETYTRLGLLELAQ